MTVAVIAAVCVILLITAFLFPRLSRHPQRGVDKTLGAGQRGAAQAPSKLGKWLQKPFSASRKATNKSAATGRRGRSKLPV
jgi:hypothetical protein